MIIKARKITFVLYTSFVYCLYVLHAWLSIFSNQRTPRGSMKQSTSNYSYLRSVK